MNSIMLVNMPIANLRITVQSPCIKGGVIGTVRAVRQGGFVDVGAVTVLRAGR